MDQNVLNMMINTEEAQAQSQAQTQAQAQVQAQAMAMAQMHALYAHNRAALPLQGSHMFTLFNHLEQKASAEFAATSLQSSLPDLPDLPPILQPGAQPASGAATHAALSNAATEEAEDPCVVCLDDNVVKGGHPHFQDCGHVEDMCNGCALQLDNCPLCRAPCTADQCPPGTLKQEVDDAANGISSKTKQLREPRINTSEITLARAVPMTLVNTPVVPQAAVPSPPQMLHQAVIAPPPPPPRTTRVLTPPPAETKKRCRPSKNSGLCETPTADLAGLSDSDVLNTPFTQLITSLEERGVDEALVNNVRKRRKVLQNRVWVRSSASRRSKRTQDIDVKNTQLTNELAELREQYAQFTEEVHRINKMPRADVLEALSDLSARLSLKRKAE